MTNKAQISGFSWPSSGSGNIGPFQSGSAYYVVSAELDVYKASDPVSTWSVQDATNAPTITTNYVSAYQDGTTLHIMCCAATGIATHYAQFDMSTDSWVEANNYGGSASTYSYTVYTPTDAPDDPWGDITVRSDGDIIIVHPGENPTIMGGDSQQTAYSRYES